MCKGEHVGGEYTYKDFNPILKELGSGGSRMYPHLCTSTPSYLRVYRSSH